MDRNDSLLEEQARLVKSLSARRAWIEMRHRHRKKRTGTSLSARRAWIEIPAGCWRDARRAVALRKESVDRNNVSTNNHVRIREVALRKESVDRNNAMQIVIIIMNAVALRKESVDRNPFPIGYAARRQCRSPQGERG